MPFLYWPVADLDLVTTLRLRDNCKNWWRENYHFTLFKRERSFLVKSLNLNDYETSPSYFSKIWHVDHSNPRLWIVVKFEFLSGVCRPLWTSYRQPSSFRRSNKRRWGNCNFGLNEELGYLTWFYSFTGFMDFMTLALKPKSTVRELFIRNGICISQSPLISSHRLKSNAALLEISCTLNYSYPMGFSRSVTIAYKEW